MKSNFVPFLIAGCFSICFADEATAFLKKQQHAIASEMGKQGRALEIQEQERISSVARSKAEFDTWKTNQKKELAAFKRQVLREWGEYRGPTNTVWVEYSADRQSVCSVDFKKGRVTIDVLVPEKTLKSEITKQVAQTITRAITSRGVPSALPVVSASSEAMSAQPILNNLVDDATGHTITLLGVSAFAEGLVSDAVITPAPSKAIVKVHVDFTLVPDYLRQRMEQVLPFVIKYCDKYALNTAQVLATIHTESHFNPMAYSSADAIGLMQLVPMYGGREAYAFVHGEDEIPGEGYLFDPEKNIELGCAYLYLLKNRYFAPVVDTLSARFCTIAAYNTGPFNVAYAFCGERVMNQAMPIVNALPGAEAVYDCLVNNLPYSETRIYLAEVTEKMALYK